ncbi:FAD-binding oxidoreductase [Streptomyces cadmiisoli]|uniref:FAD-binding oxidoreductase n=1 Tax=Streptomyces cadmiisoli TaxID=2184053 RepID=UPI003D74177F
MTTAPETIAAAQELNAQLAPGTVAVSGPAYEATRRIWNAAARTRPALVVHAHSREDVRAAVVAARRHGLPFSVRAGGHDIPGRSLRQDGLVTDLTHMRQVAVDPTARVATVGGGATAADLVRALAPHGLAAVTGTVGSVGMTGLTLGGGYGPLTGRYGLALDNLLGADLVLADGRVVTVDNEHEPELFWALRGGGGNFGVVTSMRVRLHAPRRLLAGRIVYPWPHAGPVLARLAPILAAAPDSLSVHTGLLTGTDGAPVLVLTVAWNGDPAAGEARMDRLQRLGTPILTQMGLTSAEELLNLNAALGEVTERHYTARTRSVAALTPDVIGALLEGIGSATSPLSGILLHHFHGAAARVAVESTAFGTRRQHLMAEIVAAWEPSDAGPHQAWADSVADMLAANALPGGYPNMLGVRQHAEIADAYGPHTARLLAAKARFDPDGTFTATPLPPSPATEFGPEANVDVHRNAVAHGSPTHDKTKAASTADGRES